MPKATEEKAAGIADLMRPFYRDLMKDAFDDAAELGVDVSFSISNPFVQTVLKQLAKNIKGVDQTTKDDVQLLVGRAADEGWPIERLQKEIRDKGAVASRTRATLIARTESGTAYNLGSVAAYKAGGVTHVDVLDGDDDEPCASANGSRWTLEEAEANPLGHPNCVRSFIPVVET